MKKSLVATHHISVPGYGSVTPGEVLEDGLLYLLEDEQIERLLDRGALRMMGGEAEEEPEPASPTPPEPGEDEDDDAAEDGDETEQAAGETDGGDEDEEAEEETVEEPMEMDAVEAIVDAPTPVQAQQPDTVPATETTAPAQPRQAAEGHKRGGKKGAAK